MVAGIDPTIAEVALGAGIVRASASDWRASAWILERRFGWTRSGRDEWECRLLGE
jgi:hypothetical protein